MPTQEERVRDALLAAQMYEPRPTIKTLYNLTDEKIMKCRERIPEKELFGNFRFKPQTTAERIADTVATNLGLKMPKHVSINSKSPPRKRGFFDTLPSQRSPTVQGSQVSPRSRLTETKSTLQPSGLRKSLSNRDITKAKQQKESALKARNRSVPFNQSKYMKYKEVADRPKTFFKGATEFLQGAEKSALADKDQTLKKILDDQAVTRVYEDRKQEGLVRDYINKGLLPENSIRYKNKINLNSIMENRQRFYAIDSGFSDLNSTLQTRNRTAIRTANSPNSMNVTPLRLNTGGTAQAMQFPVASRMTNHL